MNLLLNEYVINFNENFILPKNNILLVLRFEESAMDGDQGYELQNSAHEQYREQAVNSTVNSTR